MATSASDALTVGALAIVRVPFVRDERGTLMPVELETAVPFAVARVFTVSGVPQGMRRGGHAHLECRQFLICVAGAVSVDICDGLGERTFMLGAGDALYVPPLVFASERYEEAASVLLVCCDQAYRAADYIRTIDELRALR